MIAKLDHLVDDVGVRQYKLILIVGAPRRARGRYCSYPHELLNIVELDVPFFSRSIAC